jgi:hypothetical protein
MARSRDTFIADGQVLTAKQYTIPAALNSKATDGNGGISKGGGATSSKRKRQLSEGVPEPGWPKGAPKGDKLVGSNIKVRLRLRLRLRLRRRRRRQRRWWYAGGC